MSEMLRANLSDRMHAIYCRENSASKVGERTLRLASIFHNSRSDLLGTLIAVTEPGAFGDAANAQARRDAALRFLEAQAAVLEADRQYFAMVSDTIPSSVDEFATLSDTNKTTLHPIVHYAA